MATISDVVKKSGISKSTVSRVINNHPSVSEEKRRKVLQAMEELAYTPNPTARRMRGTLKSSVGLIIPNVTNPFFSYLIHHIEQRLSEHSIRLIIMQSSESREKELEFLDLLKQKQVDGIILAAVENEMEAILPYLEYGPVMLCNEYVQTGEIPIVRLDQERAAYIGVRHLIEKGYRRIAYCTGGLFAEDGKDKDRNNGLRRAMEEEGLPIRPEWVFVDQHTIADGREVMRRLWQMDDRPDAIFTGSDEVAAGMTLSARELSIRIPEDIAVLGFDDQPLAELTYPQLTTIHQPIDEMGRLAADVMIRLFTEDKPQNMNYELPISIVERQST
ncbi:LacI family DNA-binding transcriptional regulator [Alkalicoccus urumqiensis]|uniref:LacI family transcriptional regulator n=1 Tax=Alkalicoccus urumqiensis TaxID=1548213 RepID=A0A2P6MJY5_ALKUR|nr:LacI family DNA-binding transcriptional regulator [Alkalicoccus urumqiensis]PRO66571.1 LacI family transcriptional regulator [Alkalicoccus urumqiensis]